MADEQVQPDLPNLAPNTGLGDKAAMSGPNLSREELLRQAAEAPNSPLILPSGISVTKIEELPTAPPIPPPRPPAPPNPPTPPLPPTPPVKPVVLVQGADIETIKPHHHSKPVSRATRVGLGVAVGVILLLLLTGMLYVLTLRGSRVPFIYPALSGLSRTGLGERDKAVGELRSQTSYQFGSGSQISLQLRSGGPTSLTNNETAPVSSIVSDVLTGSVQLPSEALSAKIKINANSTPQVPLYFVSGDSNWKLRLPLNENQTDSEVGSNDLISSFLSLAIRPIPLTKLLPAITSQTSYHQATGNGQRQAIYTYSLDALMLKSLVPTGVTITNPIVTITYAWGSNLPVSSSLQASVSSSQISYSYQADATYIDWNQPLKDGDLSEIAASNGPEVTIADLVAQLGFTAGSLPGEIVSSALPIAAVPSGQYITKLQPQITATPPPPSLIASSQMLSNDTQRKADLSLLQSALQSYRTTHGGYPKSQGLEQVQASQNLLSALVPTYLTALPIDPTRTVFWYEYTSDGSTFSLRSVAENATDPAAKLGVSYHYFEYTN